MKFLGIVAIKKINNMNYIEISKRQMWCNVLGWHYKC